MDYLEVISSAYESSLNYLWKLVTDPLGKGYLNGLYFLISISLIIWGLEVLLPWRRNQNRIRKDFWLDTFYMFFNFYIFDVIAFAGFANLILPISCHGIIFGTHMEALGMMGVEFSLPFPPYHQQSGRSWPSGTVFELSPTFKINKCSWIVWPT